MPIEESLGFSFSRTMKIAAVYAVFFQTYLWCKPPTLGSAITLSLSDPFFWTGQLSGNYKSQNTNYKHLRTNPFCNRCTSDKYLDIFFKKSLKDWRLNGKNDVCLFRFPYVCFLLNWKRSVLPGKGKLRKSLLLLRHQVATSCYRVLATKMSSCHSLHLPIQVYRIFW
jgi:hypothetical protein